MNYFNYFSEIESTFIRRRGRNLLLSPLDWALIEAWQEREVPLHIILRGIEKVFDAADKQPSRKRTIKSLTYCREEIEAQYSEWLESQIGKIADSKLQITNSKKDEIFPDETIDAHLKKISVELETAQNKAKSALSETLKEISKRLINLWENFSDAEMLEKDLEKLDALIDENLLKNHSDENLENEIKKNLASYRNKMEDETYQRTFDLMLVKKLREDAEIPRLSLFYL